MKAQLYAPEQYWRLSPEVRKQMVNGCGTAGWKGKLVPDSLLGLDIKPACNIHDYQYRTGETIEEKQAADRVFINNLLRLIEAAGGPFWLQSARRVLARRYYNAVDIFGGPAFWKSKNPAETFGEVYA